MKKFSIVLAFFIILTGCSGRPSDSDIETQTLEMLLSDGGDELFQVENFKKINGFEQDSKTYIADIEYDLTFKKSLEEIEQQFRREPQSSVFAGMGIGVSLWFLRLQYGNFEAGYRTTQAREVTFLKTENGWRIY